jgi:hypothetical protein
MRSRRQRQEQELKQFANNCAKKHGQGRRLLAVSRTTSVRAIGTPVALFYHAHSQASSIVSSARTATPSRSAIIALATSTRHVRKAKYLTSPSLMHHRLAGLRPPSGRASRRRFEGKKGEAASVGGLVRLHHFQNGAAGFGFRSGRFCLGCTVADLHSG